jgi:hypothetical protein
MSLLGYDGFDHYHVEADVYTRTGGIVWSPNGGGASLVSPGRNNYGQCLNALAINVTANTTDSTMYVGFALKLPGGLLIDFTDITTGDGQLHFQFISGTININLGSISGPSIGSAINVYPPASSGSPWFFVEIGAFIDPSAGWITIRMNGQQVFNVSGIKTTGGGVGWSTAVNEAKFSSSSFFIDDFYWNNSIADPGTYPCNTFNGDCRVFTAWPTGNDAVQWTPLAGLNWQEVSETQFDGDTTYNSTATVGQQDTFVFTALAGTISRIICVAVTAAYRKDNAGVCTVQSIVKSGASTGNGASYAPGTNYGYWSDLYKHDPNGTIDWTLTALNAMRAGYKRAT